MSTKHGEQTKHRCSFHYKGYSASIFILLFRWTKTCNVCTKAYKKPPEGWGYAFLFQCAMSDSQLFELLFGMNNNNDSPTTKFLKVCWKCFTHPRHHLFGPFHLSVPVDLICGIWQCIANVTFNLLPLLSLSGIVVAKVFVWYTSMNSFFKEQQYTVETINKILFRFVSTHLSSHGFGIRGTSWLLCRYSSSLKLPAKHTEYLWVTKITHAS